MTHHRLGLSGKDWLFVAAVLAGLLAVSWWSRASGDLTSDQVVALVTMQFARDLDLRAVDPTVFSIRPGTGGARDVSARVLGKPCTLLFEPVASDWAWTGIIPENRAPLAVEAFMRELRAENEAGSLNALRVVNTAQVASRIRGGTYGTLEELAAAGLLIMNVGLQPPRGYRIELERTAASYRAFATPAAYPLSGVRSFYSDETLAIRGADRQGQRAGPEDPIIEK